LGIGRLVSRKFRLGAVSGVATGSTGARVRREDKKMKSLFDSVKTFLVSEDGPTAVEYAVMLALIIIVCLTAIKAVGTTANDRFTDVKNALTPAP
jgi:pilus assembly protein Flp/PilA